MDTSFFFFETLKDIYHIDENEDNTALDEQKTTDMFQNLNDELEKIPHSSELSSNKICFSGEAYFV